MRPAGRDAKHARVPFALPPNAWQLLSLSSETSIWLQFFMLFLLMSERS